MMPIRVVLCVMPGSYGETLQTSLSGLEDVKLMAWARSGAEALQLCRELEPEVLLLDDSISGPGAAEVVIILGRACPRVRTLILADELDEERLVKLLAPGAMGFLRPGEDPARLVRAIYAVADGFFCIEPGMIQRMAAQTRVGSPLKARNIRISPRQMEVLQLVHHGHSYEDIAGELGISAATVRYHLKNLLAELGVGNKYEAVSAAVSLGWISPPQTSKK